MTACSRCNLILYYLTMDTGRAWSKKNERECEICFVQI